MSGEIDATPGFTPTDGVPWTNAELAAIVASGVWRVQDGAIGTRELADGSITADKLDSEISAQMGTPDGSITTAKLATDCLAASAAGRGKMADGFFSADATGLAKFANGFLTANAAGRLKMADGFVTAAKLASGVGIGTAADRLAFRAYRTASQGIAKNVWTKVQHNNEVFDYGNCYDHASNFRFTPTIAGLYLIVANGRLVGDGHDTGGAIYENGSADVSIFSTTTANQPENRTPIALVAANGSTDYYEHYVWHDREAQYNLYGGATRCWMFGFLIATT